MLVTPSGASLPRQPLDMVEKGGVVVPNGTDHLEILQFTLLGIILSGYCLLRSEPAEQVMMLALGLCDRLEPEFVVRIGGLDCLAEVGPTTPLLPFSSLKLAFYHDPCQVVIDQLLISPGCGHEAGDSHLVHHARDTLGVFVDHAGGGLSENLSW